MTPLVRRVADIRYGEVLGFRPLELDLYLPQADGPAQRRGAGPGAADGRPPRGELGPGPRRFVRAGRGPGLPVGRLGRRASRAPGGADRGQGGRRGGLVPGHRPGGHAVRRGGRGRRRRCRAGLPRGAAPRRARLGRTGPSPGGQPGDPRERCRAADPADARDGGRHGATGAEHPAGRGARLGRSHRRVGAGAGRDALLEGCQGRARDHRAVDRVPAGAGLSPGRWRGGRRARGRCPGRRCGRRARCGAAARPVPGAGRRARRRPRRRPRRSARPRPR